MVLVLVVACVPEVPGWLVVVPVVPIVPVVPGWVSVVVPMGVVDVLPGVLLLFAGGVVVPVVCATAMAAPSRMVPVASATLKLVMSCLLGLYLARGINCAPRSPFRLRMVWPRIRRLEDTGCRSGCVSGAPVGRGGNDGRRVPLSAVLPLHLPTPLGGGFECASHIAGHGRRLDLSRATGHLADPAADYRALAALGLGWARDGIAWHLVEPEPGKFQFDTWRRQLAAAAEAGVLVIWDLLHFGLPDWIDPWETGFAHRAAELAGRAAEVHLAETGLPGVFCPVNEISFWALAGGERGWIMPFGVAAGEQWKGQLVLAAIAMGRAIRAVAPGARLITSEPLISVRAGAQDDVLAAAVAHAAQFGATDRLMAAAPGLFDAFGWNHYPHNQRWHSGALIGFGAPGMRSLSDLLAETAARYPSMPLLISETGAEGPARPWWLLYVADEMLAARTAGVSLEGACWYPVTDYPGWDDDRPCPAGILESRAADGVRPLAPGMAQAVELAVSRLATAAKGRMSLAG